jgi:hypothetical protein
MFWYSTIGPDCRAIPLFLALPFLFFQLTGKERLMQYMTRYDKIIYVEMCRLLVIDVIL